ncbi:MAG TPA: LON peptidase substrate-binding domain-containing protein [Gemmatimonadales bacterium]|nr:LON peptidase substrate-binding domain-containing protein [Gemmatimonadales bacterium]
MTRALPLFPLPVVLFPGASQALHVFEPRYRQLLVDCLEDDQRFGIAYVPPVDDPAAAAVPVPGDVGCVAVIRSANRFPDGRANILTEGERRFVLLDWVASDRSYRVAQVEEFDDEVDPVEAGQLATDVRRAFGQFARLRASLTDPSVDVPLQLPADPTVLSFHVAATLELDVADQLGLLNQRSTAGRLRQLLGLLGPMVVEAERYAAAQQRARGNGRGHPSERAT